MNQAPLERNLTRRIMERLKESGVLAYKTFGHIGRSGTPDIIACVGGYFLAIEVKRDAKSKPTPLQEVELAKIAVAGGAAYVVSSVAEVEAIVLILRTRPYVQGRLVEHGEQRQ